MSRRSVKYNYVFNKANEKRKKRVSIGGVEYSSMSEAGVKLGRSRKYIGMRYNNYDKTMPNGDKIIALKD